MRCPFFTIGHSTRAIGEFVDLISRTKIKIVIDVRTIPKSRANPQYNSEALAKELSKSGIDYEHVAALGGLRGLNKQVPADVNAFWENRSFHNYADYALTEDFRVALTMLRKRGHAARSVIMCAEAVWWRCHRRIIADYLIAAGETVFHILGPDHVEPAQLTQGARVGAGSTLTYPLVGHSRAAKKLHPTAI